jgi:hypothetical protein
MANLPIGFVELEIKHYTHIQRRRNDSKMQMMDCPAGMDLLTLMDSVKAVISEEEPTRPSLVALGVMKDANQRILLRRSM